MIEFEFAVVWMSGVQRQTVIRTEERRGTLGFPPLEQSYPNPLANFVPLPFFFPVNINHSFELDNEWKINTAINYELYTNTRSYMVSI